MTDNTEASNEQTIAGQEDREARRKPKKRELFPGLKASSMFSRRQHQPARTSTDHIHHTD